LKNVEESLTKIVSAAGHRREVNDDVCALTWRHGQAIDCDRRG